VTEPMHESDVTPDSPAGWTGDRFASGTVRWPSAES